MNAEQLQAMKINQEREAAERIRRENAVALLAEKEREIERLKSLVMSLRPSTLEARAGAAEQRLQEAQARIKELEGR